MRRTSCEAWWILVAAVACGIFLAPSAKAQTGEVYSLNVVGFQKIVAPVTYRLAAFPFSAISNSINDVIGPQLTPSNSYGSADNILLWVPRDQSYTNFYLRWAPSSPTYHLKWLTAPGNQVATNAVETGMGFWIRSRRTYTQTVVFAGDVVDSDTVTTYILPGLTILAYPYSAGMSLNDMGLTNGCVSNSYAQADNILLWNESLQSYTNFYLRWAPSSPTYHMKWLSAPGNQVATNVIPPGTAFWYRSRKTNTFAWVAVKPYTVP